MNDPGTTTPTQTASALQSVWPGVATVGLLWLVLVVTGLLPELLGWFAGLGILVAFVAGTVAAWVHLRMFDTGEPVDTAIVAQANVTRALALGFGAKLLALAVGVLVLVAIDVKFPGLAAFALAFTAAALVVQLWSAALVNRAATRHSASPRS